MIAVARTLGCALLLWAPVLPAQKLIDVYVANAGEDLWIMPPFQRGLAAARDGSVWVLFIVKNKLGTRLLCAGSRDGGKTFGKPVVIGRGTGRKGSIVADVEKPVLHVTWTANGGPAGKYLGVFYQAFDCATEKLLGEPKLLLKGKGRDDQFHAADIEMTAAGDLAMTVFTHRTPDVKVWGRGWAGGLLLRRKGEASWSKPLVINQGYTGINPNLQATEGGLAFAYRTHGKRGYGIYTREFDLAKRQWLPQKEQAVGLTLAKDGASIQPTNIACIGSDLTGNLYVLHTMGSNRKGHRVGRLEMAFGARPKEGADRTWKRVVVAEDPAQNGGNYAPAHFSLARGPGNQMYAIYSKQTESHARLYSRLFDNGVAVMNEKEIGAGPAGAFTSVNGLRSSQADSTLLAAVAGKTDAAPQGRVALVVPRLPIRTFWRAPKGPPR